jgi:putative addiction module component (TIGR02574 family)
MASQLEVVRFFLTFDGCNTKLSGMSSTELMNKAMELAADERAELARQLILSLDSPPPDSDADEAWNEEIERRLQRADRGDAKLIDWRESVERARKSLREVNGNENEAA